MRIRVRIISPTYLHSLWVWVRVRVRVRVRAVIQFRVMVRVSYVAA